MKDDRRARILAELNDRVPVAARPLAKRLGISQRTIFRDFAALRPFVDPMVGQGGGYLLKTRKEKMTDPLSLIPAHAFVQSNKTKFEAKMTFEERCAVLAAQKAGIQRRVLAAAFAIDRRTVTHICNAASPHYKDVRRKLAELGPDEFRREYLTETVARRIADAASLPEAEMPSSPVSNNHRAAKMSGVHTINGVKVNISWETVNGTSGWYYYTDEEKRWLHNGSDSMRTSQACLKACEENL